MTEELFREDATLLECQAMVQVADAAGVVLDRTVFYPTGAARPAIPASCCCPTAPR